MLREKALENPDQSAFGGPAGGHLPLPGWENSWTDTQEGCWSALWSCQYFARLQARITQACNSN